MLETKLPIFGTILFILSLIFLVYLLIRILRSISQKEKIGRRRIYSQSTVFNSSLFVLSLVFLLFSWVFFWTGRSLRAFDKFYPQALVGEMEVISETETTSRLVLTFFKSNGKSYTKNFFISGDKLQLEAEFLNFKPSLKDLGIYLCYKMVRINVLDISDSISVESKATTSVIFELLEGGTEFFFWTKKFDNLLPWAEAKVLKSDYTSVAEQGVKKIHITEERIDLS